VSNLHLPGAPKAPGYRSSLPFLVLGKPKIFRRLQDAFISLYPYMNHYHHHFNPVRAITLLTYSCSSAGVLRGRYFRYLLFGLLPFPGLDPRPLLAISGICWSERE